MAPTEVPTEAEVEAAHGRAREFFRAPYFAVAGASSKPAKFGHKIFAWYLREGFSVTPINPFSPEIKVNDEVYTTIKDLSQLPHPTETSLSIVTEPGDTRAILKQAKELGIHGVWLQPGSFEDQDLEYAFANFKHAAVGGEDKISAAHNGWCVLVDGQRAFKEAGLHKL